MRNLFIALIWLCVATNSAMAADALPELEIKQLTDDVYLHTSYQVVEGFGLVDSNGLVVVINDAAYIIDTPWSAPDTKKLLAWLEARNLTVKGSVSTHFHEDRTAGIQVLNSKNIPTYASSLTNALLRKANQAQASRAFDNNLWLVEDQIEVFYPGPGHSQDNVVVWLPNQGVLFGGCFIRAGETQSLGNVSDALVSEWPASAEKLMARYKTAQLVVPGHGKVGDVSLLEHTRALASAASKSLQP
ncbi:MAG TPA: DIM/SIM/IMP family subclass B1 metallo-beta-lactamase [Methylophilaceae bacterium]|nr:DIM/SIM/IMP family subclass B1 metallo-beta-lactamase [Methylophilaceae bacterium]